MTQYPPRSITVSVDGAIHKGIEKLAVSRGETVTSYAKLLLVAAYTARCGPSGDKALDQAVAQIPVTVAPTPGDDALRAEIKKLSEQLVDGVKREGLLKAALATNDELEAALATANKEITDLKSALAATFKNAPKPEPLLPVPSARITELERAFDASVAEIAGHIGTIRSLEQSIEERDAQHDRLQIIIEGLNAEVEAFKSQPAPKTTDLVTAIVIAFGAGLDTKLIADKCHLSEPMVLRTLAAWRDAHDQRAAA